MTAYDLTREQSVALIVRTALEYGISDPRQIAYMIASAEHETGNFRTAREDNGRNHARERGYSGGENYYGRGYVQTTHDHRYAEMDRALGLNGRLVANPDLAATDAHLGAQLLVVGVARGLYTGVAIHRYVGGENADYENARRTVNGTDRAELVAGYARVWESQVPGLITAIRAEGVIQRPLPGGPLAGDGSLRSGERGIEVHYLQGALDRLGYRDAEGSRISSDGDFGERTAEAVESFQRANGLEVTRMADAATLTALGLTQAVQNQPQPQPAHSTTTAPSEDATRRQNESPAPAAPSTSIVEPTTQRLYLEAFSALSRRDAELGREPDDNSRRIALAGTVVALRNGYERIDDIVFNQQTDRLTPGERFFVLQGDARDPAHLRESMPTREALARDPQEMQREIAQLDSAQAGARSQEAARLEAAQRTPAGPQLA